MRQAGNAVYRFGYEAIIQNLTDLKKNFDRYSEVGKRIRAIPDFIVIDKKGKPVFVEVKFRSNPDEKLHKETLEILERIAKFWQARIVFVNCCEQPYFRISDPPYIDENKKLKLRPLSED